MAAVDLIDILEYLSTQSRDAGNYVALIERPRAGVQVVSFPNHVKEGIPSRINPGGDWIEQREKTPNLNVHVFGVIAASDLPVTVADRNTNTALELTLVTNAKYEVRFDSQGSSDAIGVARELCEAEPYAHVVYRCFMSRG